jgi:hypothetical protein
MAQMRQLVLVGRSARSSCIAPSGLAAATPRTTDVTEHEANPVSAIFVPGEQKKAPRAGDGGARGLLSLTAG